MVRPTLHFPLGLPQKQIIKKCAIFVAHFYSKRIGDFFEIDTRGGARDFQSRHPTPPRAYSKGKPKTAKHAHTADYSIRGGRAK